MEMQAHGDEEADGDEETDGDEEADGDEEEDGDEETDGEEEAGRRRGTGRRRGSCTETRKRTETRDRFFMILASVLTSFPHHFEIIFVSVFLSLENVISETPTGEINGFAFWNVVRNVI